VRRAACVEGRRVGTGVSYGLGRLLNAIGPLVIAGLYTGVGYRSVFYFIAGAWLVGAVTLAVFGPRTARSGWRPAGLRPTAP
jgi:putative MFS transporter